MAAADLQLLSLPGEIRMAIYEAVVPAGFVHICRRGYLPHEAPEEGVHSVVCRNIPDVEWMARVYGDMNRDDHGFASVRVGFPGHLACVMLGIGSCNNPQRQHSGWLSLLLTCRTLYLEFLSVLYSRPKFAFHDWSAFRRFFDVVPSLHQALLRRVCVAWGRAWSSQSWAFRPSVDAEWCDIWSTIRNLPRPLAELDLVVHQPKGLDKTTYVTLRDPAVRFPPPSRPLHDTLRDICVAPNGRFTVVEIGRVEPPDDPVRLHEMQLHGFPAHYPQTADPGRLAFYKEQNFPFAANFYRVSSSSEYTADVLESMARARGLLDDSRNPPWSSGFTKTLEQIRPCGRVDYSSSEIVALEALLILRSGRCNWTFPRAPRLPTNGLQRVIRDRHFRLLAANRHQRWRERQRCDGPLKHPPTWEWSDQGPVIR
ncbi:hypothetical protein B0H63DRAFT_524879 [Podospora didyma]|uniref:DUF7730 domain-containing protein n=1 Tax=Podospora didyma TaxID=330526 RepID=A0AAE0NBH2_9PEZI|nr:hypothetical protein B0H63DRAFT_524879 [Podospora didyma]